MRITTRLERRQKRLHQCPESREVSRAVLVAWIVVALVFGPSWSALANPQGGRVVTGTASISETGNTLDVHQASHKTVIDWNSFDIEVGEHTQFHQPSKTSIALNRIPDPDHASRVFGSLSANGNVWVINKLGVLIGEPGSIDVQGLLATTTDISNDAFMAGQYDFATPGDPDGFILNRGTIRIGDGGFAALVAPWVRNEGLIHARLGRVEMAGAERFTVDLYGDGLLELALSPSDTRTLVDQIGTIEADGGVVALTAADATGALESVLNLDGVVRARSARQIAGRIVLSGDDVNVAGRLDATSDTQLGGQIEVLGDEVSIASTAEVDASGATGGGRIRIGGDFQGRGETRTATSTRVESGARLVANATREGDGGTIVVWAEGDTAYAGDLSARGAGRAGAGGFAEVSGKQNLRYRGSADLGSESGQRGTLLLDPVDMVIGSGPDATILAVDIARALRDDASDFVLMADTVVVEDVVDGRGGSAALNIASTSDVTFNDDILNGGSVSITSTTGDIEMTDGNTDSFVTQGGGTVVFSESGDVTFDAGGDIRIQNMLAESGNALATAGGLVAVERLIDTRAPGGASTGRIELRGGSVDIGGGGIVSDRGDLIVDATSGAITIDPNAVVFSTTGEIAATAAGNWSARNISTEGDVSIAASGASTLTLDGVVESRGAGVASATGGGVTVADGGRLLSNGGRVNVTATQADVSMAAGQPVSGSATLRDTGFDAGLGAVVVDAAGDLNIQFVNGAGGIALSSSAGDANIQGRIDARVAANDPSQGGGTISVDAQSVRVSGEITTHEGISLTSTSADVTIATRGAVKTMGDAGTFDVQSAGAAELQNVDVGGSMNVDAGTTVSVLGEIAAAGAADVSLLGESISVASAGRIVTQGGDIALTATNGPIEMSAAPTSGIDAGDGGATLDSSSSINLGRVIAAGGITATAQAGDLATLGQLDARVDATDVSAGGGAITLAGDTVLVSADVSTNAPIRVTSDVGRVEIETGGRVVAGGSNGSVSVDAATVAILQEIEASAGLSVAAQSIDAIGLLRETGGFGITLASANDTRLLAGGRLVADAGTIDVNASTGAITVEDAADTGIDAGSGNVVLAAQGPILLGVVNAEGGIQATSAGELRAAGLLDTRSAAGPASGVALTGASIEVTGEIASQGDITLTSTTGATNIETSAIVQSVAGAIAIDSQSSARLQNLAAETGISAIASDQIDVVGVLEDTGGGGISLVSRLTDVLVALGGLLSSNGGAVSADARDVLVATGADTGIVAGAGSVDLTASRRATAGNIAASGGIKISSGDTLAVEAGAQIDGRVDPADASLGGGTIELTAQRRIDVDGSLVTTGAAGTGNAPVASVVVHSTGGPVVMQNGEGSIIAGDEGSIQILADTDRITTADLKAGGGIEISAGENLTTRGTIDLATQGNSTPTLQITSGGSTNLEGLIVGSRGAVSVDSGSTLFMLGNPTNGIDMGSGSIAMSAVSDLDTERLVATGGISLLSTAGDTRIQGLIDTRGGNGSSGLAVRAAGNVELNGDIASDLGGVSLLADTGNVDLQNGRLNTLSGNLDARAALDVIAGEINVGGTSTLVAGRDVMLTRLIEGGSLTAIATRDILLNGLDRTINVAGEDTIAPVAAILAGRLDATADRNIVVDGFIEAATGMTFTAAAARGIDGVIALHRDLRTNGGDMVFNGEVEIEPAAPPLQNPATIVDRFGSVLTNVPLADADRNPIGTGPASLDIVYQLNLETRGGDVTFNGGITAIAPVDDVFFSTIEGTTSDLGTARPVNLDVLAELNEFDNFKPRIEPKYVALSIDAGTTGNVSFNQGVATIPVDLQNELPFPLSIVLENDFNLSPPGLGGLANSGNGETVGHIRGTWTMRGNKALRIDTRNHQCNRGDCIIPMPDMLLDITANSANSTGDLFVGSLLFNDVELASAALSVRTPITGTGNLNVTGTLTRFDDFSDAFNISNSAPPDAGGSSTNVAGGNIGAPGGGGLSGNVSSPGGLGLGGSVGTPGSAGLGGNVTAPGAGGLNSNGQGVGSQGIPGGLAAGGGLGDLPAQDSLPSTGGDDTGSGNNAETSLASVNTEQGEGEEEAAEENEELAERCGASDKALAFQKTPAESAFGTSIAGDPFNVDPFCAAYRIVATAPSAVDHYGRDSFVSLDFWSDVKVAANAPAPARPLEAIASPPNEPEGARP